MHGTYYRLNVTNNTQTAKYIINDKYIISGVVIIIKMFDWMRDDDDETK